MASRPAWTNVGGTDSVGSASITAADDLITVVAHGLADGDLVAFDTLASGADGPLVEDAPYYVRDATTDDFRVSGSPGGERVTFDSDGTAEVYTAVPSYSAEELRQIGSHDLFHGAADRLGARQGVRPGGGDPVSVAGTTWTVHDHTGVVDQSVTSTQGPYKYVQLAQAGSLEPADGSNDRYDGLDLLVEDDDVSPSGHRRSRIVYVPGTPGGGEPAVTSGANRLAVILVHAGGTPGPEVDSLSEWAVSSGGVLPVRDDTERPTTGRYVGMCIWRQDLNRMEAWDGSAWQVVGVAGGYQYLGQVRFTSSDSFVKADYPALRAVRVRCQAGGGGGGSASATGSGEASSSGGGGGGEYSERWILEPSLASSETVTVGSGGAGGTGGGNGTTGGNTLFGSHCTAIGGDGGFNRSATTTFNASTGGRGGTGGAGDLTIRGGGGGSGIADERGTEGGVPGQGGTAHLAGESRPGRGASGITGDAGSLYGGGGSGAVNDQSSSARAGADGAAGIVIVDLYV